MSEFTAKGLVEYCKQALGWKTVYMWGGLMKTVTQAFIDYKKKQYPKYYSEARVKQLQTKIGNYYGCDCVGLIKSYLFGGINSPKYKSKWDTNTRGMYSVSKTKGTIETLPEIPGLILYMKGHVGVYIGNGECIECTLGKYGDGVVKTKVAGRGWTHWLQLPWLDYNDGVETECGCDCPCCQEKCKKKTEIDNEFFGAFAIADNLSNEYIIKYPATYSVEEKVNEKYLLGFPFTTLADYIDYKHISYGSFKGLELYNGIKAVYCYYIDFMAKWFYANNVFALSEIASVFGSQAITAYLSVNGSEEIETLGRCNNLYYEGNRKANSALIFENVELNDKDKITVRFENAFTLGYSVTWEFSINDNGSGRGKPISYQATVIPWQDNVGVNRIGDYYIK